MSRIKKRGVDRERMAKLLEETRRARATRDAGYREKALALFPHVCARCGREFSGKNLRELTVHHRDHNHNNNPPDGSNWELLCVYCHDDEHQDSAGGYQGGATRERHGDAPLAHNPFAALSDTLKENSGEPEGPPAQ